MNIEQIEKRLDSAIKNGTEADVNYWRGYRDAVKAMQREQEIPSARWIKDSEFLICSNCESEIEEKNSLGEQNATDFCPNCGAKMEGLE